MYAVRDQISCAARTNASVLILGETGVGKELVARAIHDTSDRQGRFVPVDCGALPEDLLEAELFGATKGAYTSALHDRTGLLEHAHNGTLLLDEIGNLSARGQAKLLRVLQDRRIRRIGGVHERVLDLRVIAATNASLTTLRQDLVYRLNTLTITIPPLRSRPDDIPELAAHFLQECSTAYGREKTIANDTMRLLASYAFPGNVRELAHLVHRSYLQTPGRLITNLELSPTAVCSPRPMSVTNFWTEVAQPLHDRRITRQDVEHVIREGLTTTQGSYRKLTTLFGLPEQDYKRFMDFLRRYHCNVDYRGYRRTT